VDKRAEWDPKPENVVLQVDRKGGNAGLQDYKKLKKWFKISCFEAFF
jgi:hypothetical protein